MQAVRPNMRSFLHTVQKNQMLMMTPSTLGRTGVIKSFIKHTTPLKLDPKVSSDLQSHVLPQKCSQLRDEQRQVGLKCFHLLGRELLGIFRQQCFYFVVSRTFLNTVSAEKIQTLKPSLDSWSRSTQLVVKSIFFSKC